MYHNSEFGKQVKTTMIKLNLNNKTLARMLGYPESTLCDILKGRNRSKWREDEINALLQRLENSSSENK